MPTSHFSRLRRPAALALLLAGLVGSYCATVTAAPASAVRPTAPERYVVKRGDTLWDIARMYLKDPWRWKELLRDNPTISRDPRRLQIGDVLLLQRNAGGDRANEVVLILQPEARASASVVEVVPVVPLGHIMPFLSDGRLLSAEETAAWNKGPQLVAGGPHKRWAHATGDTAYATGLDPAQGVRYEIFRESGPLQRWGDNTLLGYEQRKVGEAVVENYGYDQESLRSDEGQHTMTFRTKASTVRITRAREEILVGDRLRPMAIDENLTGFVLTPAPAVEARIIAVSRDASEIGAGSIITLDRGVAAGLQPGSIVALWQVEGETADPRAFPEWQILIQNIERTRVWEIDREIDLPRERAGLAMVFRAYQEVAYALVLETIRPARVGDYATAP